MFDCTKTVDFYIERERMCNSYYFCNNNCPIGNIKPYNSSCEDFVRKNIEKVILLVQEWSDKHPIPVDKVKTYADVFFEQHPNAPRNEFGVPLPFKCDVYGNSCSECSTENHARCWQQPYIEG